MIITGKAWIYDQLHNAVKQGVITKSERCQLCGAVVPHRNMHGHHLSYDDSLDVIWVCRDCHNELHHGSVYSNRDSLEYAFLADPDGLTEELCEELEEWG